MPYNANTIDDIEFIDLEPMDINPLMTKCTIKVFYLGKNRNRTSFSKEVAEEMAKSVRGCPIVGKYRVEKEDYTDHGHVITIDDDGIHTSCETFPYGFVAPDAKVWFQKFTETAEDGSSVERTYLLTQGYIWTGQYEEAKCIFDNENGRPQSMELDTDHYNGEWSKEFNSNVSFFIVNDAIFSKLCILGEDVEPCFEGASIYSAEDKFTKSLYNMMQELTYALKGGQKMPEENQNEEILDKSVEAIDDKNDSSIESSDETKSEEVVENETSVKNPDAEDPVEESLIEGEEQEAAASFEKKEESKDEEVADKSKKEDEEEDEKKDEKTKYSLLEEKYNALEKSYADLETKYQALVDFKTEIDNAKKDDLIKSFYMLDEEDVKDIVEKKAEYSYEDIESKLSVLYTRKSLAKEVEEKKEEAEEPVLTYSLEENFEQYPDWVQRTLETEKNMK